MRGPLFVGAALGLLLLSALPVAAQRYKIDPNAPLAVKADAGGGYDPTTCTTRLQERVELTQDKTRLRGHSVVAFHARGRGGCGNIERIEAKGDVYYVTPEQRVRADQAVYDIAKDVATFTGNVVAVQGDNVTTSETLVVSLSSDTVNMTGPTRGVIYPNKTSGQAK